MMSSMRPKTGASGGTALLIDPNDARPSPVFSKWQPTVVFQTYWSFAAERQEIFYRRLRGQCPPWTQDPTLVTFKFTNVYRASDRVSQFLIREVLYSGDPSPQEIFFRTVLFKMFNKIDTWLLLKSHFGQITTGVKVDDIDAFCTRGMHAGKTIYSGASIMPSGTGHLRFERKHLAHLSLLATMLRDEVPKKLADCCTMHHAFLLLRSYPMLGDFLAYQYLIDLNYSNFVSFPESEVVVPGPGAKGGLRKCFSQFEPCDETEIIKRVAEFQETEFSNKGLSFRYLGGRRLQLIDCQNLFCEIDKYARMVHPEIQTQTKRTRIKHKFTPHDEQVSYWFPPKWGINTAFENDRRQGTSQTKARAFAIAV